MQHEAHHVAEPLDACRGPGSLLMQGGSIEGIEDVEKEVGIDLGAQELEVRFGLAEGGLESPELEELIFFCRRRYTRR